MATALQLVKLAATRLGEKYVNVRVPKNNRNWHGPWDCAEFAAWLVFQKTGKLFGCTDNTADPALAEAYSGGWVRDAKKGLLLPSSEDEAVNTPGVFLIRMPPAPGQMGHVALSDGHGMTVEAAGTGLGIRRGRIRGRVWHFAVRIPGLRYTRTRHVEPAIALPYLLTLQDPNIRNALARKIQQALRAKGFDPGRIDGAYGPHTMSAVIAFQATNKLVADGACGPLTAKKLGVKWPPK